MNMETNPGQQIEVFHDGECPVCQIEIAFYEKVDHANRIAWTDIVTLPDADLPTGKTREDLLGRFHVRDLPLGVDNKWYVGVDAFARIWRVLPVFRWLAWTFSVPGIRPLAELAYRGFLKWQAGHRARRAGN
jgi:predicted DCC family thiol-disulfide oxidoreductase YuxK